jgi:hypothetical protein
MTDKKEITKSGKNDPEIKEKGNKNRINLKKKEIL